ncbi:hypothetical protein [Demequina mangrovi]|nr:hypothetical protein [Demequina mangrovi]
MTTNRKTFMAAMCGAMLLAGCSADAAETTESAVPDAGASAEAGGAVLGEVPQDGERGDMGGGGLTGEIAYVTDGTAQVQDGSSQTAVNYDAATDISIEVDIAFADLAVGECVVATLGDDDAATEITVSEAEEDGTCASDAGGFGERGDGDMPEGMERPDDGEMPTDMPTAMPDGDMPEGMELPDGMEAPEGMEMPEGGEGGFAFSTRVAGTLTAIDGDVLTIETTDGDETVTAAGDVTVTTMRSADADAIEVGLCMTAIGESDESGGYSATVISLFTAGDDGCESSMFAGRGMGGEGGMGGAPAGGETAVDEPALESEG